MIKKIVFIFLGLVLPFFIFSPVAFASSPRQITIVNPIRGEDFWSNNYQILDTPEKEYQLISKNNLPATWLVRYDALKDVKVQSFLKSLNSQQEVGLFLEITPTLARDANVKYNQSANWHFAKSVFLIGYSPVDRQKLIDTAVKKYVDIFGTTPKSVGAWWIDSYSLDYLRQKYGVVANLDVSDQFTTDEYSIWGQYFSTPFYQSKVNALMPAQSLEQKNGIVTIQWATRDPYNSFGNGVSDSTYSVQVNDYELHNLGIDYFQKLLNIYPQVTVGLENDFSWSKFGQGYKDQISLLASMKNSLSFKTMREFASYYSQTFPDLSPNVLISSDDPLGGGGKVVWYMSTKYRAGWFYTPQGSVIRDLRLYNGSVAEACFNKACDSLNLALPSEKNIDDVTFSNGWLIDQGQISNLKVSQDTTSATISYQTSAGTLRTIQFLPNDIRVDDKTEPISAAILNEVTSSSIPVAKIGGNVDTSLNLGENLPKIVDAFKFIFLLVFFLFLPGWVISRSLVASLPLGFSLFTLLSFVLNYLHLSNLLWGLPLFSLVLLKFSGLPKISFEKLRNNWKVLFLILTGSLSWYLTVVKSGLFYNYGLGFWGPNGHDGVWHLSLISELMRQFPPQNPVFAGVKLSNYHYFFDLLLSSLANLLNIDPSTLLFQLFPLILALLCGLLIFATVKKIFNSSSAFWATFFLYFGGSFGFIISYFRNKDLGGESTFWSQQAVSTLLNPPFAISIVIFLAGLYILWDFLKTGKVTFVGLFEKNFWRKNGLVILVLTILWGSLIEFKVYGGVLTLGALGILTAEKMVFKKDFKLLAIFVPSAILSILVFLPNNSEASSLLYFSPFWLVNSMVNFPDRLNWQRLALTLQSGNPAKLFLGYSLGLLIFLVGNLGTRILGIFKWRQFFRTRFLTYIFILGLVLSMVFIQVGTNWNIVQFFYYCVLIFDIFAGVSLSNMLEDLPKVSKTVVIVLVIALTLPTTLDVLITQYLGERPPAMLSSSEFGALTFLKAQPQGTVLTLPFDPNMNSEFNAPVPLLAYTSTAYVSAFSNHPTFLEDTVNLDILGVEYKGRLDVLNNFTKFIGQDRELLRENNISYVYLPKAYNFSVDGGRMDLKKIFENSEVKIFKVE